MLQSCFSFQVPLSASLHVFEGFNGTLQMLDDCGPQMTFDHADIYSGKRITLGKERILRHIVLPYRLARSSRGYSLYQRQRLPSQEAIR